MENDILAPVFIVVDEHLALQSVDVTDETEDDRAEREHIAKLLGDIATIARKAQLKSCSPQF